MAELEEWLARMERTGGDFAAAIQGASEIILSRRPVGKNWAAKEIVCHLRDTEELFLNRFQIILTVKEPKFSPADADRWAAERQYLRNDAGEAISAFRARREDTLQFLRGLKPEQWERACIHATRGRMTVKDYVGLMAAHDNIHLEQLKRALASQP
jgi:uncharacterized damage-inducible protein DinB